jgi:hypothetical protein
LPYLHLFHPHDLGSGVIGLTSALKLQEEGYHITIIAEIFPTDPKSPKYTSQWAVSNHYELMLLLVLIYASGCKPCQFFPERGSAPWYVCETPCTPEDANIGQPYILKHSPRCGGYLGRRKQRNCSCAYSRPSSLRTKSLALALSSTCQRYVPAVILLATCLSSW